MKKDELIGLKVGLLTVVKLSHVSRERTYWLCNCECGNTTIVVAYCLKGGNTKSCGCLRKANLSKLIHGCARRDKLTSEFNSWQSMIGRCFNENNHAYADYGGRGITVCERWRVSFQDFLTDMGEKPSPKHSLDRFPNNNGNYELGNCRWATQKEQCNNTRRNTYVTHNGETKSILEWAAIIGMSYNTLRARIRIYKMTPEEAFSRTSHSKAPRIKVPTQNG